MQIIPAAKKRLYCFSIRTAIKKSKSRDQPNFLLTIQFVIIKSVVTYFFIIKSLITKFVIAEFVKTKFLIVYSKSLQRVYLTYKMYFWQKKTSCYNFRRRLFFLELFPWRFDSFGRGGHRRNRPQFRLVFRSFGKNRRKGRFPGWGRLRFAVSQQTSRRHPGKKRINLIKLFNSYCL